MGTVMTVVSAVGGAMAGFGANLVAQGLVMDVGFKMWSGKFSRACISCASMAIGSYAWVKTEEMWHKDCEEVDGILKDFANLLVSEQQKKEEENAGE